MWETEYSKVCRRVVKWSYISNLGVTRKTKGRDKRGRGKEEFLKLVGMSTHKKEIMIRRQEVL